MLAIEGSAAKVEDALLVLAETVIVLVTGRGKTCANAKRLLAVHRVRRHLPTTHLEELVASRITHGELYRWQRRSEVTLHLRRWSGPRLDWNFQRQLLRGENVATVADLMSPSVRRWRADKSVPRRR